jgi:BASS family bile acid:Na+ symporter
MDPQQLILWAFQLSIIATAFRFGLKATTDQMRNVVRHPERLGRSLVAMFVVVPAVAVIIAFAFDFPHAAEVAIIALAISPLAALLPGNLFKVGRHRSYPVTLIATVALLSIVITPLLATLIGRYLGQPIVASPLRAAGVIAATVLLPLVAGMVVRAQRPALADRVELPAALIGTGLLHLATLALLVTNLRAVWELIANGMVIAIAVLVVAGLMAGHLLGGSEPDQRTVLALASGFRHPAVALAIAAVAPSEHPFAAAIGLYLLLGDIFGLAYTIWRQRSRGELTDAEAASIILDARQETVDNIRAERPPPYYLEGTAPPAADRGDDAKRTKP